MKPQGWENIYKEQGEVQVKILAKVKDSVDLFKRRGFKKILDLGCGTGRHAIFLAQNGFEVYATDISNTGLAIAKKKAQDLKLNNIYFARHDMKDIPFEDNFFDAVLCVLVIDHGTKQDLQKTVNEIYRVLKKDSIVITDFMSTDDETCGKGIQIEKNTFVGSMEGEDNIAHHYSTEEELEEFFQNFTQKEIVRNDYIYKKNNGDEYVIKSFDVKAIK